MVRIIPFSQTRKNAIAPMDSCGNRSVAVIQSGASMIPVCEKCLDRMSKDLKSMKINSSTH